LPVYPIQPAGFPALLSTSHRTHPAIPFFNSEETNMQTSAQMFISTPLIPVQDREQLQWLVKESEMLTGRPGREFFLLGENRPALNVLLDHSGYEIVANAQSSTPSAFPADPKLRELTLEFAFSYGLLFTTPIQ
jgi:hypothetical protein